MAFIQNPLAIASHFNESVNCWLKSIMNRFVIESFTPWTGSDQVLNRGSTDSVKRSDSQERFVHRHFWWHSDRQMQRTLVVNIYQPKIAQMIGKKASRVDAHWRNPTPRNYDQDVVCCYFVGFELNVNRALRNINLSTKRNRPTNPWSCYSITSATGRGACRSARIPSTVAVQKHHYPQSYRLCACAFWAGKLQTH